jgi:transposase-like protein
MARKPVPIAPYIDKLEQAIGLGATYELAALYAGVSSRTLSRWRSQAEDAKPGTALAELRDRLRQAEGRAAIGWLAKIELAARNGDWRAAAYQLAHRYPEVYGHRVKANLRLEVQQAVQEVAAEVGLDPAQLLREAQQFLREHDAHRH